MPTRSPPVAATARASAAEGATVLVTDLRDAEGQAVAAALGPAARYRRLDARRAEDWATAVDGVLSVHPAAILTPMWEAMLGEGPGRAERETA